MITEINKEFWKGKRVFVTGHTGFKGSWLCLLLVRLGASVSGYSLKPPTDPSMFALCHVDGLVDTVIADVRDAGTLSNAVSGARPEIVIHMAAEPLVRESYLRPSDTFEVNVMGVVNLFEAVRKTDGIRAVINVTTDKCYETDKERLKGYVEGEPLGGYDPYSSSKACSELVTSAYRSSFFNPRAHATHGKGVATARAGNVVGGGDWSKDRLVPDIVRAICSGKDAVIRNPGAIRPWQHVLEPLTGYMLLAEGLYADGPSYSSAWNFGPDASDAKTVEWMVKRMCERWGRAADYALDTGDKPHETGCLLLDSTKAKRELGWRPKWNMEKTVDSIIDWTRAYKEGKDLKETTLSQIEAYMAGQGL